MQVIHRCLQTSALLIGRGRIYQITSLYQADLPDLRSAFSVTPMPDPLPPLSRFTRPFEHASGLPAWWLPLLKAAGTSSVFLSAAWMQTWLEVFGADFTGIWVWWELGGETVAGCLLLERMHRLRGFPMRTLYLNTAAESSRPLPFAEYNDVLCCAKHELAVARDLAALLSKRAWSCLKLSGYETGGVSSLLAALVPNSAVEEQVKPARYVDLSELRGRAFEATLSGKSGTYVRRNQRWFAETYGNLEVHRAADLEEALQLFEGLRALHITRFSERGEVTSLSDPDVVTFHHRLIRQLWSRGEIELIRIGKPELAIGYLYNFVMDSKVFVFQTGFFYQPDSKWSPGLATHVAAIQAYGLAGRREYDFMSGDAQYKKTLASHTHDLHWTTLYHNRLSISVLLRARRFAKAIRRRARRAGTVEGREHVVTENAGARSDVSNGMVRMAAPVPTAHAVAESGMNPPLVSVVIASYNAAATLPMTLDSVLAQSYPNIEIIVVDDGSKDHTTQVLERYAGRVRIVQKQNGGLASARNAGCKAARGDFIALLDADDLCAPERIGIQVDFLSSQPGVVLCGSDFSLFDETGVLSERYAASYYSRLGRERGGLDSLYVNSSDIDASRWVKYLAAPSEISVKIRFGTVYPALATGNFVHPPTVMFRRDVLANCGWFDEGIRNACDWEWFVRVARFGPFGHIDRSLLQYRKSPNQMSGPKHKLQLYRDVLANLERFAQQDPSLAKGPLKKQVGEACVNVAEAFVDVDRVASIRHLSRAAMLGAVDRSWARTLFQVLMPRPVWAALRVGRRLLS